MQGAKYLVILYVIANDFDPNAVKFVHSLRDSMMARFGQKEGEAKIKAFG